MTFDPNKLPENKKEIYAALTVQFGAVRAQELIESLETVQGQFRKAHEKAVLLEKGLDNLNKINRTLTSSFSTAGRAVNSFTGFINAPNVSMKVGYDIFIKYNDAIVKTSSQFSKYSLDVGKYTSRLENLRKTYQLSYQDATRLMSTLERGFNFNGPEKYDGYMKAIAKTVGNNIDAMNEFSQAVQGLTSNNPALEDMVANLDFKGAESYAKSLAMAGEISVQQYKTFKELALAQSRSKSEQGNIDTLQRPGINQRGLAQSVESGLKESGRLSANLVTSAVDWAGGLDKVNEKLSTTIDYYSKIQALSGIISGSFSTMGGAVSGGLDALDAAASAKILLGGKAGAIGKFGGKALGAGIGLAGTGAAAIKGMGAAAMSGGGLALAGSGALMAGAAFGGFEGGDYIAKKSGFGIYDWSGQIGDNSKNAMNLSNQSLDPRQKAQYKAMALSYKAEQEKMESLGGLTGIFRSEGVASDDTLKALAQAQEELQSIVKQEKAILEEEKKQVQVSDDLLSRQRHTNQILEIQKGILSASNALLSSRAILSGKAANTGAIFSEVEQNNKELDIQEKILRTHKAQAKEQMDAAQNEFDRNKQREIILKDDEELNQIYIKRNANAKILIDANQAQIETQEKAISLTEAYVSLQDSAGMGLRAQVGARKQLIDQISVEMQMVRQQTAIASQERQKAQDALDKAQASGDIDTAIAARAKMRDMDNEILDKKTKETQLMQKQAEISKSMREGWISAINAMTTGAGVFTRITIDQNKRLGNLAFASPNSMNALRIGGTTGGRTDSASWTPGGFKEGKAGSWEQGVMSQYGVSPNNSMQETANAMMKWQDEKGSKMSPAAAAFGIGPQAAGEITSAIQDGFKSIGGDSFQKSGAKLLVSEKDIEDIKKSFVEAFAKIGTEIVAETIKRIRDK